MNLRHAKRVLAFQNKAKKLATGSLYGKLNETHVRARSRAMVHLSVIEEAERGLYTAAMLPRACDHTREIIATAKWMGWRALGFSPAQIVGGQVGVSDMAREMSAMPGGTTPPW